jgi:hypothetical protein
MNPRDRVRLQHLADALNSAIRFAQGRERGDLDSDEMLLFALVRAVEIAGEAASQVTAETRAQLPDLPWSSIVEKPTGSRLFRHQSGHPLDHSYRGGSSPRGAPEDGARGGVKQS